MKGKAVEHGKVLTEANAFPFLAEPGVPASVAGRQAGGSRRTVTGLEGDGVMSRIHYDGCIATVYDQGRAVPLDGLAAWRAALARYLPPEPGLPVLDLGAGTGLFAVALAEQKHSAGTEVAAASASIGVSPASTRRASS